jgi:hypothetical protein
VIVGSPVRFPHPSKLILVIVGTSSIHAMFQCSGMKSSHYCCCGSNRTHTHCNDSGRSFSDCMRENTKFQRPILEGCGDYDVYAQMDGEVGSSKLLEPLLEHAACISHQFRSFEHSRNISSATFRTGGASCLRSKLDIYP